MGLVTQKSLIVHLRFLEENPLPESGNCTKMPQNSCLADFGLACTFSLLSFP